MQKEIQSWAKDTLMQSNSNFDILHDDPELTLKKIKFDKEKVSLLKKINIFKKKSEKHIYILMQYYLKNHQNILIYFGY